MVKSSEFPMFDFLRIAMEDIAKIINKLKPNKAQDHELINIQMLPICALSVYNAFTNLFGKSIWI